MIAGERKWESFPAGTPESTMIAWREQQAKKPTPAASVAPAAGSFAADIVEYGKRRAAMRSIRSVIAVLHKWAGALGRDRDRNSIRPDEIETQLQQWQIAGMHASTARKVVAYLQAFYRHLNGDAGPNPARLAQKPARVKYNQPRAIPYAVIAQILDRLEPHRVARGGPVRALAPYRLRVVAYTGLPPVVLARLRRADIDLEAAVVHLPPRLKGAGVEARSIPLTTQGVEAFRAFIQARAYGPFRSNTLNRAFRSAAKQVGLVDEHGRATVHTYDLRHSFGTMLYDVTRDLATVGRFLGHAPGSANTQRYALGANRDVDRAAAASVSARLEAARRDRSAVA